VITLSLFTLTVVTLNLFALNVVTHNRVVTTICFEFARFQIADAVQSKVISSPFSLSPFHPFSFHPFSPVEFMKLSKPQGICAVFLRRSEMKKLTT
jgi:hypothetical protein